MTQQSRVRELALFQLFADVGAVRIALSGQLRRDGGQLNLKTLSGVKTANQRVYGFTCFLNVGRGLILILTDGTLITRQTGGAQRASAAILRAGQRVDNGGEQT